MAGRQNSLSDVRAAWAANRAPLVKKESESVLSEKTARNLSRGPAAAVRYIFSLSPAKRAQLKAWASSRQPNYWYILFNVVQIVTCLAILVIGFVVVQEAKDDLKANIGAKLVDAAGEPKVKPCAHPAPDMLHLLRLQGVYENMFGMPQLIEPDYRRWNVRVQGSLCAADIDWTSTGNDGLGGNLAGATETLENRARKLHALASIMSRLDLEPTSPRDSDHLDTMETLLLNELCVTDQGNRTYSKRLHDAFGDPFTRIARAYLAAAPAFRVYRVSKDDDTNPPSCLGENDPFGYTVDTNGNKDAPCANADYINRVLDRAGSMQASSRLAGIDEKTAFDHYSSEGPPDVLEMLYALYALSIINHYDKTLNDGQCFVNANDVTAYAFCGQLYDGTDFSGLGAVPINPHVYGSELDIDFYRHADSPLYNKYTCSASTVSGFTLATSVTPYVSAPAPPPFNSYRGAFKASAVDLQPHVSDADGIREHVKSSCAAIMQYGLYDQERLFGVPDVLLPFQYDNRPDASLHFLGALNYNSWFVGPMEETDVFKRPGLRLELYLAYRLAALTLWGSLVASVAGFFIGRSGAPLGVAIAALVLNWKKGSGEQLTVVQPSSRSVFQDTFTLIAVLAALITAYYTLFVDPSAQSYYPTTPDCSDFLHADAIHSAGGAYVTSWGKRRFSRYSETQIGAVLIFLSLTPFVYTLTKVIVQTRSKTKQENRRGVTKWDTALVVVLFVSGLAIVLAQAGNCMNTGTKWMDAARVTPWDTTSINATLGKDCLAQVLLAFWVGLAFSVNRASWCFINIDNLLVRWAYYGTCILLIWLTQLSYVAILPDEYADAFSYPSGDSFRQVMQVLQVVGAGAFSVGVAIERYSIEKEGRSLAAGVDESDAQASGVEQNKDTALVALKSSTCAPADRFAFDLGAARIAPDATGQTGSAISAAGQAIGRLPLPAEQRRAPGGSRSGGRYMPMLRLAH